MSNSDQEENLTLAGLASVIQNCNSIEAIIATIRPYVKECKYCNCAFAPKHISQKFCMPEHRILHWEASTGKKLRYKSKE